MRAFFLYVSLGFFLLVAVSCAVRRSYPPVIQIPVGQENRQYNYSIQFRKKQLEGILVVRRMNELETRFMFTTYFGMSVFDYSFRCDSFLVNSSIEPLRNRHVEALMASDFRILFAGNGSQAVQDNPAIAEKRTQGRGFLKTRVFINGATPGNPDSVRLHHPWLKLTMNIRRMEEPSSAEEPEALPDSLIEPDL